MKKETITISISKSLLNKVEEKMKDMNFNSVSDYMFYVLSQSVSKIEENEQQKDEKSEEERVEDKLRILGYMD